MIDRKEPQQFGSWQRDSITIPARVWHCAGRIRTRAQRPRLSSGTGSGSTVRCPLQIWKGSIVKIYVGNLSYNTGEDGLRAQFSQHGAVSDVFVATDRETGRSRGFGFVTMPDDAQAKTAIEKCNGTQLDGRTLTVNEARPPAQSGGGGGGGGYGGGGGGGRGGYRDRR